MQTCPECGARVKASTRQVRYAVAGRAFVAAVPARACTSCGARYLDHAALERSELLIAAQIALSGPISGESFRFMRKALGALAVGLAADLGVSPETISRWETGQRRVDRCAWIVVGSLVLEAADQAPRTLARLRGAHARGKAPVMIVPRGSRASAWTRAR